LWSEGPNRLLPEDQVQLRGVMLGSSSVNGAGGANTSTESVK